jgi:hypothetical protein
MTKILNIIMSIDQKGFIDHIVTTSRRWVHGRVIELRESRESEKEERMERRRRKRKKEKERERKE